ncbi:MAG: di-trans,poly-cis-decaprenylcistransferase [Lachnospiraceae bacterium]|nr:di-trans,poly-cis-decaprenylcistransferase [Lachnospiraceae bacterium]
MGQYERVAELPKERIPQHVAIILDGNGRWAAAHNVGRSKGHLAGAENVETISDALIEMGVKYLTVYAFSTENWKRSEEEVSYLMMLLKQYLIKNKKDAIRRNIQIKVLGDKSGLSKELQLLIEDVEASTAHLDSFHLQFAINYGGRDELCRAMKKIAAQGMDAEEITQDTIAANLDTAGLPDPDLLIRTSGELRISNFLLWQLAYSEFYFSDKYWPDFTPQDLEEAILDYARRDRRFGGRK